MPYPFRGPQFRIIGLGPKSLGLELRIQRVWDLKALGVLGACGLDFRTSLVAVGQVWS